MEHMRSATCSKQSQMIYRPRRPEKTVLFGLIKKHYRTWKNNLKHPLSRYVEKTFEKYLGCGNPAKGFAWAYCNCCHTDFMIAFSCKCRGICPSCSSLTMVKTAAHLVEHVIPSIPVRQWVISFPLRIRHYLLEPGILQNVHKQKKHLTWEWDYLVLPQIEPHLGHQENYHVFQRSTDKYPTVQGHMEDQIPRLSQSQKSNS
ncbi:MAG: transposase zinc-binding domain-containing protein [Chlamydiales bacterium]